MKGYKEAKIVSYRIWVDGNEIKSKKNIPETGKVVFCKMFGEIIINDNWYEFVTTGRAVCGEEDEFNFQQGRDIAFIRAKKAFILKCLQLLDKLSQKTVIDYYRMENVLDYANYELMALGAKKQPEGDNDGEQALWEKISHSVSYFAGPDIDRLEESVNNVEENETNLKNKFAYILGKYLEELPKMDVEEVRKCLDKVIQ